MPAEPAGSLAPLPARTEAGSARPGMDWQQYRARCEQPQVWSRWMLVQTLELVAGHGDLIAGLRRAMAAQPLAKPPGHKGGSATDMFELDLKASQVDAILALVRQAVERGADTAGTRGRGLGGFTEAWLDYRRSVAVQDRGRAGGASAIDGVDL